VSDVLPVHLHISEPWDFERHANSADFYGQARHGWSDGSNAETEEGDGAQPDGWVITLEEPIVFESEPFTEVFVMAHYVGDPLNQIVDPLASVQVNVARRTGDEWTFGFVGTLSLDRRPRS
jgi:hypothetical protein